MKPERWRQIEGILDRALERPPASWPALLEEACGRDDALRQEVETLLHRCTRAEGFLEQPAAEQVAWMTGDGGPAADRNTTDPLVGKEIGEYRILGVLGRGGMGVVYKAEDTALARVVALKSINPELARNASFLRRFRSEARALARIDSPHITRIHALRSTPAHGLFIVMEYVEGGTLADVLEAGRMSESEALPLIGQMLTALEHAHRAGVIHRDIKPHNILITPEGQVKVTDFGLARMRERGTQATLTQKAAGTLNYMSPEQVKCLSELDHRTDLYSLGMTLYEMLTGRLPFDRESSRFAKMRAIVKEKFPPPDRFRPGLSEALTAVVAKMLEKNPGQRFQSAAATREALQSVVAEQAPGAGEGRGAAGRRAEPTSRRLDAWNVAAWNVAAWNVAAWNVAAWRGGALVLLLLLAGGVYFALTPSHDLPRNAPAGHDPPLPASATLHQPGFDEKTSQDRNAQYKEPGGGTRQGDGTPEPAPPLTPATLTLRAEPSGTVSVGAERRRGGGTFEISPGPQTVRFSHPQYGTKDATLDLSAGQSRRLTCYFRQTISVNTAGPWGSIWVNGRNTGLFTPNELRRGPGTYRVEIRVKRNPAYAVTGGAHRIQVAGEEQTTNTFSGSARTVVIEPSFAQKKHALVFQVREEEP